MDKGNYPPRAKYHNGKIHCPDVTCEWFIRTRRDCGHALSEYYSHFEQNHSHQKYYFPNSAPKTSADIGVMLWPCMLCLQLKPRLAGFEPELEDLPGERRRLHMRRCSRRSFRCGNMGTHSWLPDSLMQRDSRILCSLDLSLPRYLSLL
jgi:hypothetical protein